MGTVQEQAKALGDPTRHAIFRYVIDAGVPVGVGEGGMPVGLQLLGNYFQEGQLLHAAHALQQATDWHLAAPAGI